MDSLPTLAAPLPTSGSTLSPSTVRTERLTLRPWTEQDIPVIRDICQDPELLRWVPLPTPYETRHAEWYVKEFIPAGYASGDEATFAIEVTATGQIAGTIALKELNSRPDVKTGEIGFWANAETRGNGYMTEAVRALVRWAFEEIGVRRVIWQAHDGNLASRRVAEKAGFTIVGRQRGSHLLRGVAHDMWLADILPGDLV